MVQMASGLILTPELFQRNVTVDLNFEPSVGILARKLNVFGMSIRSFKEPLKQAVKDVMIPSIRRNFDAGGRPRWVPLQANTIVTKKGDKRPLIRTGALRRQMGYQKIWTIDSEKAMITDLPEAVWYGKVHQAGLGSTTNSIVRNISTGATHVIEGEADFGSIPARPFVMFQRGDYTKIDRIFDRWVAKKARMAGVRMQ